MENELKAKYRALNNSGLVETINVDVIKSRIKQGKKNFDYVFLVAGDINANLSWGTKEINDIATASVKYSLEMGANAATYSAFEVTSRGEQSQIKDPAWSVWDLSDKESFLH